MQDSIDKIETTSTGKGALGAVRKSPVAVVYKRKHFVFSVSLIAFDEEGSEYFSTLGPRRAQSDNGSFKTACFIGRS